MQNALSGNQVSTKSNEKTRYVTVKRIIDIVGAIFGVIIFSPIFLVVTILIKIESPGPAIFTQERIGYKGKKFKMYKFRSMVYNAENLKEKMKVKNEFKGPMFKMKNDPRITRIGKIIRSRSIDELPQLINVIKGEMSLVGPRPSLEKEVDKLEEWMKVRLEVKPGLTCYWQIQGRSSVEFVTWMELDRKYVYEKSLSTDIKLIWKTLFVLFGDKNAY